MLVVISDEFTVIIRIDGGVAHGLKPLEKIQTQELPLVNESFKIRKDVPYDIIYNISIEN